jgi:hypothetical protein
MPMTMPELLEYGYAVHPGMETFLSVTPEGRRVSLNNIENHKYHDNKKHFLLPSGIMNRLD